MNECTSAAGHFDGHGGAPVRCEVHWLMQHDQGFNGNHWTPQSSNYLLRITPSAARATINLMMMQHVLTLLVVLLAIAMRQYYTVHIARWRRFVAFIKATKRHHRMRLAPILKKGHATPTPVVSDISLWKRAPVDMLAPKNNRGMTYQTNEKHLTIFPEYFVGAVKLAIYCYNNRFLLRVFTNNLLNIYKMWHQKTPKLLRLRVFGPPRLAPYHTPEIDRLSAVGKLSYLT